MSPTVTPDQCPDPGVHGNPFRYCPYCDWTEVTPVVANADPRPEWIAEMVAATPPVTPLLVDTIQHAARQVDAALEDSRIDGAAAAWLRHIKRTLLGDGTEGD